MVTTRSEPRKQTGPEINPVVTPPKSARVHDQGQIRPKIYHGDTPSHAYENTYVPTLGNTLTSSPSFGTRDTEEESLYFHQNPEETAYDENVDQNEVKGSGNMHSSVPNEDEWHKAVEVSPFFRSHDANEKEETSENIQSFSDDNLSSAPSEDHNNPQLDQPFPQYMPPLPTRSHKRRTANQLQLSESEDDLHNPNTEPTTKKRKTDKPVLSDLDDSVPLIPKRDETRRGTRLQARVRDRDKCQNCFDAGKNCDVKINEPCTPCQKQRRKCQPLQLGVNGALLSKRKFSKTPVQQEELDLEE